MIDSPVLPDELDALPALLEQAGFPAPSGLLATHGDWDHLLGRLAFPGVALGCAESTAERLPRSPGEAQRELRALRRRAARSSARGRSRSARSRRCPCPGAARSATRARAAPAPGPHRRRDGDRGSPGRACWSPATTSRRSRSRAERRRSDREYLATLGACALVAASSTSSGHGRHGPAALDLRRTSPT